MRNTYNADGVSNFSHCRPSNESLSEYSSAFATASSGPDLNLDRLFNWQEMVSGWLR